MTAKELREKRAKVAVQMRAMTDKIHAENRDFTAEEKPNWELVNKDYDSLSAQITVADRTELVEAEQRAATDTLPGRDDLDTRERNEHEADEESDEMTAAELGINERNIKPEIVGLAMQGWMRSQSGLGVEQRHIKAARIAGINLNRRFLDIQLNRRAMTPREYRALSAVDAAAGATIVAPSFSGSFEVALLAFGGMRQVAQVIRTDTGAEMPWPTANDTGNEGHIVGESVAPATNVDPTFGAVKWNAYKYTSDIIQVPAELLEDSAFDLASEVGRMTGERIGRRQNRDFTVGNAASKPKGIVTASTLGVTAASATTVTADEVVGLIHSVDPAYRTNARLMFADSTLLVLRKLKDGNGRYLFQDATAGASPTIWGSGYEINQHMAAIATGAKSIIYGQLDKYKIRDVRTIRMRRLVERYADQDLEGFVAFQRSDGNLLDAGVAPVKHLIQA